MTYLFKVLVGTRFGKILLALVQEILQVANTVADMAKRALFEIIDVSKRTIINGDFNFDFWDEQERLVTRTLRQTGFIQIVKEPTRITKSKKSLLDHVLINSKMEPIKAHTLCFSIADHLPILTLWNKKSDKKASENEIKLIYTTNERTTNDTVQANTMSKTYLPAITIVINNNQQYYCGCDNCLLAVMQ